MEKLSISKTLKAAWHQVKGSKFSFFMGFFTLSLIQILMFIGLETVNLPLSSVTWLNPALFLLTLFLTSPLSAGFAMMGLKRARAETLTWKSIFTYYRLIFPLFVTALMAVVIVWISCAIITAVSVVTLYSAHLIGSVSLTEAYILFGLACFVFLFTLLSCVVLLGFTFVLKIDGKASALSAPFSSIKMAFPHFWRLLWLNISLILIFLLSLIPMGLGLLWSLPLIHISLGHAYEKIRGEEAI